MNKYKLLIFDMDGTIADTDKMLVEAFHILYDKHNKPRPSDEKILTFSGPSVLVTRVDEFPEVDEKTFVNEFNTVVEPLYHKYCVRYPHEKETLKHLKEKGYKLAVVTNKIAFKAKEVLEQLEIDEYFDFLVGYDDVTKGKPDPEGINKCLKFFSYNASEAIYIGDNDMDYLAGNNAKMDTMIVSWGPRKLTVLDKATYVVNSYEEMENIL